MQQQQRTILVTFAGRRDRMGVLSRYVQAAIALGLIDEWHVWDFSRNREDAQWLREKFPVAQTTPNYGLEYFRAPERFSLRQAAASLQFEVRATHDVHLGLRRISGTGPSFEIILGGWDNNVSAIRKFDDGEVLLCVKDRPLLLEPVVARETHDLLSEFAFSRIRIEMGESGLEVFIADRLILKYELEIDHGEFEVMYRTGYGSNGVWSFPSFLTYPSRLFIYGKEEYLQKEAMFYTSAYQYYASNERLYNEDVIIKCDDDIVYISLNKLRDYISFRRQRTEFVLVGANVINNGVCAFFQQSAGLIPMHPGTF